VGTKVERDEAFITVFAALGHLTHLIQDAAAAAHTRNDPHIPVLNGDRFHAWADADAGIAAIRSLTVSAEHRPAMSLFALPANPLAPIAIARLIDATDDGRAGLDCTEPDGGVCGNGAGIAEYSNARFLSDDRLFDAYAHPAMAATQLESVTLPNGKVRRYYRFAAGHGENDYYLGVRSVLAGWLPSGIIHEVVLDDRVLADYGRKLFPKAVGYSAALLDYFFRGTGGPDGAPILRMAAVDLGTGHGTLRVTNESAEDMQGGTLHVFYDHRTTGVRMSAGSTARPSSRSSSTRAASGG
jgi:hypothetical protein